MNCLYTVKWGNNERRGNVEQIETYHILSLLLKQLKSLNFKTKY